MTKPDWAQGPEWEGWKIEHEDGVSRAFENTHGWFKGVGVHLTIAYGAGSYQLSMSQVLLGKYKTVTISLPSPAAALKLANTIVECCEGRWVE